MRAYFTAAGVEMVLSPFGDRALMLRAVNGEGQRGWRVMAAAANAVQQEAAPWIVDVVPAYDSVTVICDLMAMRPNTDPYELAARTVAKLLEDAPAAGPEAASRVVDILVCYGGASGPDLADCATRAGMDAGDFAAAHAAEAYEVAMVGFMPGFPYLTGLPERLAQPRRQTPRQRVPAGAVGIAGGQTGVYPFDSPGGWQLIGQTPLRLFRPELEEAVLFRPGDRVRFVAIDANAFAAMKAGRL